MITALPLEPTVRRPGARAFSCIVGPGRLVVGA